MPLAELSVRNGEKETPAEFPVAGSPEDISGSSVDKVNWDGLAEGATWKYKFHIKEALDGEYSVGTVKFKTGDIKVVGQVKATKRFYDYWSGDNLAAVGTAKYKGTKYYFMFLYAERATWLALSTTPYDTFWETESVWGGSLREYELHSKVPDETFEMDYKMIH